MFIRLGEIIKDAREYKEITVAELADFAFDSAPPHILRFEDKLSKWYKVWGLVISLYP